MQQATVLFHHERIQYRYPDREIGRLIIRPNQMRGRINSILVRRRNRQRHSRGLRTGMLFARLLGKLPFKQRRKSHTLHQFLVRQWLLFSLLHPFDARKNHLPFSRTCAAQSRVFTNPVALTSNTPRELFLLGTQSMFIVR